MRSVIALILLVLVGPAGCTVRDAAPSTTTLPGPAIVPDLVLRPDGLGEIGFGASPEDTIVALTPISGSPDGDTGWIDGTSGIYGRCPGEVRVINWGSLALFFGPGEGAGFFAYSYGFAYASAEAGVDPRRLDLTTEDGVGLGTSVADLEEFAADVVVDGDPAIDVWTFAIDPTSEPHLRGQLTGRDLQDVVLFIETSTGCE
jgi:hypothetical protein